MSFATARRYPWRPFRFKVLSVARVNSTPAAKVLDAGCGNHSPATTKLWWPHCDYSGLDLGFDAYGASDLKAIDHRYAIDCERDSLSSLPARHFDVIIVSHLLEHLSNGPEFLGELAGKLAPGGYLYVETPSPRSLTLPSMPGCLNFHDDATHVRVYELAEIVDALSAQRLTVVRAGIRRDPVQMLSSPFRLAWKSLRRQPWQGSDFWDLMGFAHYVLARRV
jgi:trans-aconitate methyltransferase